MGHRHMFNTPQIVETDNDQSWNYAEQPYMPIGRDVSESSSIIYPVDGTTIQGGHYPSQWTPASKFSAYSSSIHNGELPHYQTVAPCPSRDPSLHQPASVNLHMHQDNYSHRPSSSNMGAQTVEGVHSGFYDQPTVSGKGPYKRKSPAVAPLCDGGSTSRYYNAGSSSDIHLPVDPWQEKQSSEFYHTTLEYPPSYGVNTISVGSEGTLRNIRSRAAAGLETNLAGNHLSNSVRHSSSYWSYDQTNSGDFWGQSLNPPTREWNQNLISHTADSAFFNHDPSYLNTLNNHSNGSLETGGLTNDVSNRNHIPQNVGSNLNQSVRGSRSGYGQRSSPTFRASSSNFCPGYAATSDQVHQMVAKGCPSRHPRPSSSLRFRNVDRIERSYVSSERYRASTEEGVVVTNHSSYYGSRAMVDQHRDMRLDIDNMNYEELLALGERIGSVSTGLSDGLISKCLTESIYCSSDLFQDDGTCVICLEEYKNMDDVGILRVCGHDFHVACIKKWLPLKNLCPICKSPAIDDNEKGK
ncbi:probable E3 ubiquitin-protein ligase ZFP1 isoform X2 [Salvia miltiorrhiza]|uniref:probable E3 ubiquitin-protein ligase ZFP1 isoform X2 n=1 Tax=Salvia miltiorrhiza TaxID=226208 RepID=UPI0025AD15B4|nr:probable E3 ubiquitin-protein ligase ZFP1 isoform X2 [Salvia miltiorrhiza]XP_057779102.1 probable E3 ubiquitin-protein ligase ZFP1 isoform X2 [Salvia miltiorrhiza]XP_057779103.1 probable E3 ubiquitin-protein ligase ZFP1 isoform X2 [Salvia miltiorrhiza]XP_057779104.1 probable E3 ubiquitin-protein ligase ZFP1 isoform X2 [Salvia miltiorrhiza]XP_057779105.1 probable E3 ubiquitin-protein ligase ZFP1 isoform X2 [Salvia miltiorrhiza]XP_057779106.1 probable E3 ubiquitin-protein ligase ZFP1 isoform 